MNVLLFNASSSIVDADMKMFSGQTLSLEERQAAGGRAHPSDDGRSLGRKHFLGGGMEPCQGDQEQSQMIEIISINLSNGVIIQTNINWHPNSPENTCI